MNKDMIVIKRVNVSYDSYWNDKDKKWGGLLDATIFKSNIPTIENGKPVDFRQITSNK